MHIQPLLLALVVEAVAATTTTSSSSPLATAGLVPKQLVAARRRPGLTHKEYLDYHVRSCLEHFKFFVANNFYYHRR